jgi:hypothetical protein
VGGIGHTLVLALGELTWPRPEGALRRVRLRRREVRDVVPRRLLVATRVAWVATAAALAAGIVLADSSGRALTAVVTVDGVTTTATASPFPGSFYAVPLLACLAVLALAVEATLRLVVNRPTVVDADEATDLVLRRASSHRVLRGGLAATLLTAGPTLVVASSAARVLGDGTSQPPAAVAVLVLGVVVALAGLAVLAVPAPRVRSVPHLPLAQVAA